MKKPPKSELDIRLGQLRVSINRAKSDFSFKNARTHGLMLVAMGYTEARAHELADGKFHTPITIKDIENYAIECEAKLRAECAVPEISTPKHDDIKPTDIVAYKDTSQYLAVLPGQLAVLFPEQADTAKIIFDNIVTHNYTGQTLIGGTGDGKTFVMASVLANLININFHSVRSHSPWPYLVITKATAVEQTRRVFTLFPQQLETGNINIINIEMLRSSLGEMFIKEETVVISGEAHVAFKWKPIMHPLVAWWDECQVLKNDDSQQATIARDLNNVEKRYGQPVYQVSMSATPFSRVSDARHFAVSTGIEHEFGISGKIPLIDNHWGDFSRNICGPRIDPIEYSPTAVKRFTSYMSKYIIRLPHVRAKFPPINTIRKIDFRNAEEKSYYDNAWNRFLAEKARLEGEEGLSAAQSRMMILAQFTQFRKAAELCRAVYIAEFFNTAWKNGLAPGAAVCFKGTIEKIVKTLIDNFGWTRNDISIIWGGASTLSKKKKKQAALMSNTELLDILEANGLSIKNLGFNFDPADLEEKTEEQKLWEQVNRMGAQNQRARQLEIDRFQHQKSRGCIYTFKAGGVALSLHDEFPESLPRTSIITPTYSGEETVQGVGRFPRKTSRSITYQFLVYYNGTIEEHVAARVAQKLRCLRQVVRQKESWESLIVGYSLKERKADDEIDETDLEGTYVEDEDETN